MPRRPRRTTVTFALVCCLSLAGCSDSGDDARVTGAQGYVAAEDGTVLVVAPDEREPAPGLSGELVGGGSFAASDIPGDAVVVVNVWGSWCAPCRAEAATLETVYRDVRDQNVLFVGLNTRDKPAQALAFLDRFDVTYPNLDDNDAGLQLAFRDSLPSAAIPTTWVIDREGRVAARALSGLTEARLRGMLDSVLAETPLYDYAPTLPTAAALPTTTASPPATSPSETSRSAVSSSNASGSPSPS